MLLRSLRPRRRPLYGAQLCAVASAFLLLLSVALLYNRLSSSSSSSSSQNPRHLHSQSQWQLQDEEEDSDFLISSDSNGDKIDELDDVVEVDKDRRADADDLFWDGADQDNNYNNNNDRTTSTNSFFGHHVISSASSGYFLDHVTGSIRRALNKRSIDQWDYDYNHNFHSFGAAEDDESTASNSAFASDDIPIDEVVRRKLGDVVGVEDALLLKTAKRASPLRQGWGDWFDKKADFLRRDRMFKSNLEVLNPVNNPLLQDPDVVGVTGLTRGDKAVHKLLLSEFKRTPFLVKKPLSVSEIAHEDNLAGNVGDVRSGNGDHRVPNRGNAGAKAAETELETMPEMKGSERRTLDENASNGLHDKAVHYVENNLISGRNGNLYRTNDDGANSVQDYYSSKLHIERIDEYSRNKKSNGDKNPLEEVTSGDSELRRMDGMQGRQSKTPQQKSEDPSHVFADGKRWGYFPGLHPHLSFSDFMGSFFKKGKCSMTVFMVWNSPPWMYSVRHQRGLESLLSHHRDACVVVFSETIELDFFKNSFLKDGYKVAVAMPNLDELLKDTPTHVFASVWLQWRNTKFYPIHYSELVRLAALYKYGGIYLDSDIIVLNPFSSLNNTVGLADEIAGSTMNGAVMAFTKHSPFIMESLKEFYMTYDDTRVRWNGADLLMRVARNFSRKENKSMKQELKVQPSYIFFPIGSQEITRYFTAPVTAYEKARQDAFFKRILSMSLTFHFWNSLTSTLIPEPESLVARLIDHACIHCSDVL